jgi:hypothetical protein
LEALKVIPKIITGTVLGLSLSYQSPVLPVSLFIHYFIAKFSMFFTKIITCIKMSFYVENSTISIKEVNQFQIREL